HPYVTGTEGYPGLVMNGGLTTLLTVELARRNSKRPVAAVASRNVRPMFANRPITFGGEPSADGKTAKLWAADDTGALALTAEAEFRVRSSLVTYHSSPERSDMAGGPLEGVRVVDLTSVVVGPLATQILADHGAEVIKVESKTGDLVRNLNGKSVTPAMGAKFLHLNRNKRSIVLDLKRPAGYAALCKLLARADVMIWNNRPPSMARMKLAYADVRAINPRIIYCGMFGFVQDGRYRDKPAYDTIIQGSGGMSALHHRAMGEPRFVPMVVADKVTGLIAVQMIAMALYGRSRTGEGCSIEIPMFENMGKFVLEGAMYLKTFVPPLGETGDPRLIDPLGNPVPTKDGWICLSANTQKQVFAFFDAIGRPELKTDPRFSTVPARFANVKDYFEVRFEAMK